MRKLGIGHSLLFLASPEVYRSIQDVCRKGSSDRIDTSDVTKGSHITDAYKPGRNTIKKETQRLWCEVYKSASHEL
jgi:hypothetical protein